MVRHQAIGPAFNGMALELSTHQIEINLLVARFEENALAALASLRHVVRYARHNHAGKTNYNYRSRCRNGQVSRMP